MGITIMRYDVNILDTYEERKIHHLMFLIMVISILTVLTYNFLERIYESLLITYVPLTILFMTLSLMFALTAVNLRLYFNFHSKLSEQTYKKKFHELVHYSTIFVDAIIFSSFNYSLLSIFLHYIVGEIFMSTVYTIFLSLVNPIFLLMIFKRYYQVKEIKVIKIIKIALSAIVAFFLSLPLLIYDSVVYSGLLLYMLSLYERRVVG